MEISKDIPTTILQGLESTNVDQRRSALIKLIQNFEGSEVESLVYKMCQSEPDQELKYLSRKALTRLRQNSKSTSPNKNNDPKVLIDQLLKQNPDKRQAVYKRVLDSDNSPLKIELLNRLFKDVKAYEERSDITSLIRDNLKGKDVTTLPTLIKAIGIFGSEKEVSLLQKYLNHSDARVVANAVESLDFLGFDYTSSMVNHLLSHEDNRVRGNAIALIFKFDSTKGIKEIVNIAKSDKAWMRATALYCIDTLAFENKDQLLIDILKTEFDPDLKAKASKLCLKFCTIDFAKKLAHFANLQSDQSIKDLLIQVCKKLALDQDLLIEQVSSDIQNQSKEQKSKEARTKDSKKREQVKKKINAQKSQKNSTPLWQLVSFSLVVVTLLSFSLFIKIKVIDQKNYAINPLSKRKAITSDSKKLLMASERLINNKQYDKSIKALLSYLKKHKHSKRAKFLLSETLILQNKNDEAYKLLIKLSKKFPSDAKIFHRIGVLCIYRLNKIDEAIKTIEIALKLNPKSIKSLKAMAEINLFQGNTDKAQEYYDTITKIVGTKLKLDDYYNGLIRSML